MPFLDRTSSPSHVERDLDDGEEDIDEREIEKDEFRNVTGALIYRHHGEARTELYTPGDDVPASSRYTEIIK